MAIVAQVVTATGPVLTEGVVQGLIPFWEAGATGAGPHPGPGFGPRPTPWSRSRIGDSEPDMFNENREIWIQMGPCGSQ